MNTDILITIVVGVMILGIFLYVLKSLFKAAFVAILISILFWVGWTATPDEIIATFRMEKYMAPEKIENFKLFYENFRRKRDADPVFIPDKMQDAAKDELKDKINDFLNTDGENSEDN